MSDRRVVVVGGGIAGLVAALELACRGLDVRLVERAGGPGGKMREVEVDGRVLDAGPTVLTMRWVFEELFDAAGAQLADHVALEPAGVLARHAWSERERLDLHADPEASVQAIGEFAGAAEARRYLAFCARARQTFEALEHTFIRASRPNPVSLVHRAGLRGLGGILKISPFTSLWEALGEYFHDPRLRQLFGRYATYCGSSPFTAPATLMLVAHVELAGVWRPMGGMHQLAHALATLAGARGARLEYGREAVEIEVAGGRVAGLRLADGERLPADAIVFNGDVAALATGRLGQAAVRAVPPVSPATRSLSALTWNLVADTSGFALSHHNVFFSRDYVAEFEDIFARQRLPAQPTVYVCAQDRNASEGAGPAGPERLLCLVNAPAVGDRQPDPLTHAEIERCETETFRLLERCGLQLAAPPERRRLTRPADWEQRFPATGGALYGQASHGWRASFSRPGTETRLPGLYLAGGSVHPGPGVPMAALSGRLAARTLLSDLTSRAR